MLNNIHNYNIHTALNIASSPTQNLPGRILLHSLDLSIVNCTLRISSDSPRRPVLSGQLSIDPDRSPVSPTLTTCFGN